MTWVIGLAKYLLGAALVSDARVSFVDAGGTVVKEVDLVRKIHAVGPNLGVGFAGSVETGFLMVEELRRIARSSGPSRYPDPNRTIWRWSRRMRFAWEHELSAKQKAGGCELIVVGAWPSKGLINANVGYILRSPGFSPDCLPWRTPTSIGSGSNVAAYRAELSKTGLQWLQAYSGFDLVKEGPLTPFGAVLAEAVERNQTTGVGSRLHLCIVRCGDILWGTNEGVDPTTKQPIRVMPRVAESWAEFTTLAKANGVAGLAALG